MANIWLAISIVCCAFAISALLALGSQHPHGILFHGVDAAADLLYVRRSDPAPENDSGEILIQGLMCQRMREKVTCTKSRWGFAGKEVAKRCNALKRFFSNRPCLL